jgi:chaperonin cofactor prefoldin
MLTKQDRKYIDQKIEDLAVMIQGYFSISDTKLNNLETKVDSLETKIDGLENRMDSLENKVDSLENKVDALDKRVYDLEGRFNTFEFKLITAPSNRLDRVEDDIRIIKNKIGLV